MRKRQTMINQPVKLHIYAAAFVFHICGAWASEPAKDPICEREMTEASRLYGIPLNVLFAVGLTETGHRGVLGPYDLNVDGQSLHFEGLNQAIERINYEEAHGAKFIDVGCMQINRRFHQKNFASLTDMFDPAHNVRYAARFLKDLREREGSWTLAVARYNAGPDNNVAQRSYVCAVIKNMVKSGFGRWTPQALSFCGNLVSARERLTALQTAK